MAQKKVRYRKPTSSRRRDRDPRRQVTFIGLTGLRHHYKQTGEAKKPYTKDEARRMAQETGQIDYECSYCHRWHLATPRRKKEKE